LGLCASERRRDTARTVMLSGADLRAERIAAEVAAMVAETGAGLEEEAETQVTYKLRYAGQAFELPVPGPVDPEPAELVAGFERAHEERYGHRDPEGEVVLVDIDLALVVPGPAPRPVAAEEGAVERGSRRVRFGGEWVETPVLRGEPAAGTEAEGPVVFELPEATFVVPPRWSTRVDEHGTIVARAG
jgi:N-methylhydantoinase A